MVGVSTRAVHTGQIAVLLEGGMIDDLLGVGGQPGAGFPVTVEVQAQPDQIAGPSNVVHCVLSGGPYTV